MIHRRRQSNLRPAAAAAAREQENARSTKKDQQGAFHCPQIITKFKKENSEGHPFNRRSGDLGRPRASPEHAGRGRRAGDLREAATRDIVCSRPSRANYNDCAWIFFVPIMMNAAECRVSRSGHQEAPRNVSAEAAPVPCRVVPWGCSVKLSRTYPIPVPSIHYPSRHGRLCLCL
ncbi:hypothetical protein JYU34_007883 [Plutella xylostella]|uniref:Uncharacterized protein n=1 Tax=Plutella xylostella TaxID=51655 RepID=A0ABQ7QRL5_PLUXY|nr:hypothetical protein JYU34_007883 [Plutella xylostella]